MRRRRSRSASPAAADVSLLGLSVEHLERRALLAATLIPSGQTVEASLTVPLESDQYASDVAAGELAGLNLPPLAIGNPELLMPAHGLGGMLLPDAGLPLVGVTVDQPTIPEDAAGPLQFTFTREGDASAALTVNFAFGGTAAPAGDYQWRGATASDGLTTSDGVTGSLTFAPGQRTKVLAVDPVTDPTAESDETVRLTLTAASAYRIASSSAEAQIVNDDPATFVSVTVDAPAVREDGTVMLRYIFTRTGDLPAQTVNFRVGGDAVAGQDYLTSGATTFDGTVGTITFAAGESAKVLLVRPSYDSAVESNESVRVDITEGIGYGIGSPSGTGAEILDDDPTPTVRVTVSTPAVPEVGNHVLQYTFTRSGSVAGPLTVNFRVSGSAVAGEDYDISGATTSDGGLGKIALDAGQISRAFAVRPIDDLFAEPHESVRVDVTAGSGYALGAASGISALILNDDLSVTVPITSPAGSVERAADPTVAGSAAVTPVARVEKNILPPLTKGLAGKLRRVEPLLAMTPVAALLWKEISEELLGGALARDLNVSAAEVPQFS